MDRLRPYVLLSSAVSLDGHLDDSSDRRLLLSDASDFDRVDEVRAGVDAILVGANTLRADDPRLVIRSADRVLRRERAGLPAQPVKVTVTSRGPLDPTARFFTTGSAPKLVYCNNSGVVGLSASLASAVVIGAGEPLDLGVMLADLAARGVQRLMVEGGGQVLARFLADDLADELHLAVAPVLVGDPSAPRFTGPGPFRLALSAVGRSGGLALLRYARAAPAHDRALLAQAVALADRCPPSATAFSVGAVIADGDGTVLATGYSRETDPHDHAEEAALSKLDPRDPRLAHATIYSSLEPCGKRASRPRTCTELILGTVIPRVVYAWREPVLFVDGDGAELLDRAGRIVVEDNEFAERVQSTNAHLLRPSRD